MVFPPIPQKASRIILHFSALLATYLEIISGVTLSCYSVLILTLLYYVNKNQGNFSKLLAEFTTNDSFY